MDITTVTDDLIDALLYDFPLAACEETVSLILAMHNAAVREADRG